MGKDRDFKGIWTPKGIWLSPDIDNNDQRVIWSEINSLDNEFGCVADNQHFMNAFKMTERQVQRVIKALKDKSLISVEINKAKDTRVMRIIGKYKRIPDEALHDIIKWRNEVADKFNNF